MADVTAPEPLTCLYHERQVAALCGVHTINTLLQGPFINEVDLAAIAQEFDAMERQFMAESGLDSEEYKRFLQEESGNVAADGMFSIQVLSKALEVWGLACVPLRNPEVRDALVSPEREVAFICNYSEHWFTIRKVNDSWWNFNSLLPAPAPLSDFYLAAFLTSLREQGYTIFVVRGTIPSNLMSLPELPAQGRYYTPEQARSVTKQATEARSSGYRKAAGSGLWDMASESGTQMVLRPASRSSQPASSGADDDLQRAIAASLEGARPSAGAAAVAPDATVVSSAPTAAEGAPSTTVSLIDASPQQLADLAQQAQQVAAGPSGATGVPAAGPEAHQPGHADNPIALSGGSPAAAGQTTPTSHGVAAPASSASQQGSPAPSAAGASPGPGSRPGSSGSSGSMMQLAFRMPAGDRVVRKFRSTQKLCDLYYMLTAACKDRSQYDLLRQFPRVVLPDDDTTIAAAGILNQETLTFQRKPQPADK